MITPEYVRMMAGYNSWQNQALFGAADGLNPAARNLDRGAFFGSIQRTLSHVLWGDMIWMSRFDRWEPPKPTIQNSPEFILDWDDLKAARIIADERIEDWATRVTPDELSGDISWYSGAIERDITRPRAMLVTHMFNHQTHHRGQVHAMVTQAGHKGWTSDLAFMPEGGEWLN